MGETPSVLGKRLLGSKALALIGVALMIAGGLVFLNSLGLGGGYFPAFLVFSGLVLVLVALWKRILKAPR